jgi:predicted RNase H-like nuclease (RuvC/YqgF family)
MSEDYWKKLTDQRAEALAERQYLQEMLHDKTQELRRSLKRSDEKLEDLDKQIEEARTLYQSELKSQEHVKPGLYWGRNKFRDNPDQYDMIILVEEANMHGVQEWCLLSREPLNWADRKKHEYKLGEFIAEDRR